MGLGEEHLIGHSDPYVLTMYLNSKKCFAFVELRSIELASACLDLDGIIYKKIVLKILRANEYKPELLHPSIIANIRPIKLDLSSFSFGNPNSIDSSGNTIMNSEFSFDASNNISQAFDATAAVNAFRTNLTSLNNGDGSINNQIRKMKGIRLDDVIQVTNLGSIEKDGLCLIGFPFDNHHQPSAPAASGKKSTTLAGAQGTMGSTQSPSIFRNYLRKFLFGSCQNPEFDLDLVLSTGKTSASQSISLTTGGAGMGGGSLSQQSLSGVKLFDVGDVLYGKSPEDTRMKLAVTVSEVLSKGALPFIVGGTRHLTYFHHLGAMSVTGGDVGIICISATLGMEETIRLLEDNRFCVSDPNSPPQQQQPPASVTTEESLDSISNNAGSCQGKYARFAAQVLMYNVSTIIIMLLMYMFCAMKSYLSDIYLIICNPPPL